MKADDLDELARWPIVDAIPQHRLSQAIRSPPFLTLALNLRDVHDPHRTPTITPGLVFRAGKSHFAPEMMERLRIRKVYDLRSEAECKRDPHTSLQPGVELVWEPTQPLTSRMDVSKDITSDLLLRSYISILQSHAGVFRQIFLDLPGVAGEKGSILLHCTAGKDRTGVATALVLSLTDCPPEAIAKEYALTRIGIEPAREKLAQALQAFAPQLAADDQRLRALSESQPDTMLELLRHLDSTYGGVQGYAEEVLRLSPSQVQAARDSVKARSGLAPDSVTGHVHAG